MHAAPTCTLHAAGARRVHAAPTAAYLDLERGVAEAGAQDRVQRRQVGPQRLGGVGRQRRQDRQRTLHSLRCGHFKKYCEGLNLRCKL